MKLNGNSNNVYLRPLCGADVQSLFAYRSLPEVYQFQGWQPSTLTDAVNFIEEYSLREGDIQVGHWHQLGICLKDDESLIGDCGFQLICGTAAAIGYTLAPSYHRKGMGTEAVNLLVEYLFNDIGLDRIFARTLPANTASVRLLQGIGFKQLNDKEYHSIFSDPETGELAFVLDKSTDC
ncbi:GNAT family N-acetyltransferase [bacterium]|nr:GNAT family N-acetyltransferase [bacterium]